MIRDSQYRYSKPLLPWGRYNLLMYVPNHRLPAFQFSLLKSWKKKVFFFFFRFHTYTSFFYVFSISWMARMKLSKVSIDLSNWSPHCSLLNLKGSSNKIIVLGNRIFPQPMDST